jgi:hypothetical protein
MNCPNCDEEIGGSYLPVFKCPHCESQIWRDESGDVISFEDSRRYAMKSANVSMVAGVLSVAFATLILSIQLGRNFSSKGFCEAHSSN